MAERDNRIYKILSDALQDSNLFLPGNMYSTQLLEICWELWTRDYICAKLKHDQPLCTSYPIEMVLPLKHRNLHSDVDEEIDEYVASDELLDLVLRGRLARTRGRFPVPSILIGNKYVCRSSTLAHPAEIYARHGINYFTRSETAVAPLPRRSLTSSEETTADNSVNYKKDTESSSLSITSKTNGSRHSNKLAHRSSTYHNMDDPNEWMLSKARKHDIDLLHQLKVNAICDLMVENKKAKYGMYVTSSEKVDNLNRYADFELMSIPYPGCEFFTDYARNQYVSVGLEFDWTQTFIDAELKVPANLSNYSNVDWNRYRQWELVEITQNYLKLILNSLISPDYSGVLVHCISGWDRTPLFVSLVRLSLWADGLIHTSLDAEEMVFLTLVYDWLLFSHLFSDRVNKEEEILHFCFDFLKFIDSEKYSLLPECGTSMDSFFYEKNSNPDNHSSHNILPTTSRTESENTCVSSSEDQTAYSGDAVNVVGVQRPSLSSNSQLANGNSPNKFDSKRNGSSASTNVPAIRIDSTNEKKNEINSRTHSLVYSESSSASASSPQHRNTFTSNDAPDPNHASTTASSESFSSCSRLESRLKKRKEKLAMVQHIFIPIYSDVVQAKKQQSSVSGGGLSSFMLGGLESLVKMVTRT